MATVFLDGAFVDRDAARVSAFDAGIQHGVGLFETMLGVRDPTSGEGVLIVGLRDHMERLVRSARELGLSESIKDAALAEACIEACRREAASPGGDRWRVRLTVTGGDLNLLESRGERQHRPTVLIACQPAAVYPEAMFERGVMVALAAARVNPLDPTAGHKTLNYWLRLRELQLASAKGAAEALIFQVTNHACGGCVSNLFVVREGVLHTPVARGEEGEAPTPALPEGGSLPSPVLPGITRMQIARYADDLGVGVSRRMLTIDDILDGDEVFLTNSSWGVLPVVSVEATPIGAGRPGELTLRLRERWVEESSPGGSIA